MQAAIVSNGSRLSQMQARFQQKQLQQKEEKMLRLYETQQQRVLERVGRGSAGSDASTASSGGGGYIGAGAGKVRQMFDERRNVQKAGIDRSYPLEPIKKSPSNGVGSQKSNGHTTVTRGASLDRFSTYTKKPSKTTTSTTTTKTASYRTKNQTRADGKSTSSFDAEFNHITSYEDELGDHIKSVQNATYQKSIMDDYYDDNDNAMYQLKKQQQELEDMMTNHNLDETLDDIDFPDMGLIEDDDTNVFRKLPNIGKNLPSERVKSKVPDIVSIRNTDAPKKTTGPDKRAVAKKSSSITTSERTPVNVSPTATVKKNATRVRAPVSQSTPKPAIKKTVSSPVRSTSNSARSTPTKTPTSPMSKQSKITSRPAPNMKSGTSNVDRDGLVPCDLCGRRFAQERLQVHQSICAKTSTKKRKPYDALRHRVQGTEAEQFVRKTKSVKSQPPQSLKKTDWRRKHEDFINAIRSAKQAQAHVAAGGKLSDLPPPPPSYNPDYVECPHCHRKFNQAAAERHIPKCADYQFNKPGPKAAPAKKR